MAATLCCKHFETACVAAMLRPNRRPFHSEDQYVRKLSADQDVSFVIDSKAPSRMSSNLQSSSGRVVKQCKSTMNGCEQSLSAPRNS